MLSSAFQAARSRAKRRHRRAVVRARWTGLEILEPRLLLSVPQFVTPLLNYAIATDGSALTLGIDGLDTDGHALTITADSDDPNLTVFIPQNNRYALLHFTEADGTPLGATDGDLLVQLFETRGGPAAERFITLAENFVNPDGSLDPGGPAYYTDVNVHRIIPGFMIQSGDAQFGNGSGGSPLPDFDDQFDPDLAFVGPGALAMANSGPDSNNSQFFITDGPTQWLDQLHMIFGQTIRGQAVYDDLISRGDQFGNVDLPIPILQSVQIIDSDQDGTVTIQAQAGWDGQATVTISLDDGAGNVTEQQITIVSEAVLGDYPLIDVDQTEWLPSGEVTEISIIDDGGLPVDGGLLISADSAAYQRSFNGTTGVLQLLPPIDYNIVYQLDLLAREADFYNRGWSNVNLASVTAISQTPDAPPVQGRAVAPDGGASFAAAIDGNIMYVANGTAGLQVFDITDPTAPDLLGSFDTAGTARHVEVVNGVAYVADGTGGFISLDVSDPTNIQPLDLDTGGTGAAQTVLIEGNVAFVPSFDAGLIAYDISDPTDIVVLGTFFEYQPGLTIDAAISAVKTGNTLYLTDPNLGIFVLNVADLSNIKMSGIELFGIGTSPFGLDLQDGVLYAATNLGLSLFNVADPLIPKGLFALSTPVAPAWVKVSGDTAIVAMTGLISFVDVANPSKMSTTYAFAASYFDATGAEALDVAGIPAFAGTRVVLPFAASGALVMEAANVVNIDAGKGRKLRFTDGNGVEVTVSISVDVPLAYQLDNDTGDVLYLVIGDPDDPIDASDKAKVTISSKGGDARIVDILVHGSLTALLGKTTDLLGTLVVSGTLKTLQLDDVADQHTITIGPPSTAADTLTVTLGQIVNLTFDSQTPIKSFTAVEWLDTDATPDQLIAPWVGKLATKGDKKLAVAGHFQAGMILSGAGNPKLTLGSAKIAGNLGSGDPLDPAVWDITGDIGSIDASKGTIEGWQLDLHSNIKSIKLGLVEQASLTIGDVGAISATQWNQGQITAESIKSFATKANSKLPGANGDARLAMTLTGSANPKIKLTLGSAKIGGDLGSGDALAPVEWDISGNLGSIDASKGTIEGWNLNLHSNVKSIKLGLVEQANLTIGDAAPGSGLRGDAGAISATQWNQGQIIAGSIKSFATKANRKLLGADGDARLAMTLTGSANPKITLTLSSAKISGDLGSGDALAPVIWDITGNVGSIDASKGTVEGWNLNLHSNVKSIKLGLVEQASLTIGDEDGSGLRGDVGAISASQWNLGQIIAGSIKSFATKANSKLPPGAGADGDVKIDLTLTGSADAKVKHTLGKASIAGSMLDVWWEILSGDIGSITAGIISGSQIRAGIDPSVAPTDLPAAVDDFLTHSTIGSIATKGIKSQPKGSPTLLDSIFAAWTLGSLKLSVVETDNSSVAFGFAADTIKSVAAATATGIKFPKLAKLDLPADVPAGFNFGDFELVLV